MRACFPAGGSTSPGRGQWQWQHLRKLPRDRLVDALPRPAAAVVVVAIRVRRTHVGTRVAPYARYSATYERALSDRSIERRNYFTRFGRIRPIVRCHHLGTERPDTRAVPPALAHVKLTEQPRKPPPGSRRETPETAMSRHCPVPEQPVLYSKHQLDSPSPDGGLADVAAEVPGSCVRDSVRLVANW